MISDANRSLNLQHLSEILSTLKFVRDLSIQDFVVASNYHRIVCGVNMRSLWNMVCVYTCTVQAKDVLNDYMSLSSIKTFAVPCSAKWNQCSADEQCAHCFSTFRPNFTMNSFETCADFHQSFDHSCTKDCNDTNVSYKQFSTCVADMVFYILTLGSATHFCTIYGDAEDTNKHTNGDIMKY